MRARPWRFATSRLVPGQVYVPTLSSRIEKFTRGPLLGVGARRHAQRRPTSSRNALGASGATLGRDRPARTGSSPPGRAASITRTATRRSPGTSRTAARDRSFSGTELPLPYSPRHTSRTAAEPCAHFCTHPRGFSVVIDHHGRIVVAGTDNHSTHFCVARYKRNGQPRPLVLRQRQGEDVVRRRRRCHARWRSTREDGSSPPVATAWSDNRTSTSFALARYRPNGTLDRVVRRRRKGDDGLRGRTLPPSRWRSTPRADRRRRWRRRDSDFALARYRWNGGLDPSFGSGGKLTTDFPGPTTPVRRGDRLAGTGSSPPVEHAARYPGAAFALARYEPNGDLDPSFVSGTDR